MIAVIHNLAQIKTFFNDPPKVRIKIRFFIENFVTKDTPNYLALWQAKGEDIRARRQHISTAVKQIIDGIEKKVKEAGIEFE